MYLGVLSLLLPKVALACGGMQHGERMPGMGRPASDGSDCGRMGKFKNMPGTSLFQDKGCVACHTLGEGDKTGPDLEGLFQRRSEKWVKEFLQDPVGKVLTDPKAKALKERYGTQMPPMELTPHEIDQIIEFLKKASPPR
ncbi:MAG: cytochrome c [bacterium]